jgi:hypothetical protein
MKWRLGCKVCGKIISICEREDYVYQNGEMNITHCGQPVNVLVDRTKRDGTAMP